MTTHTNLIKRLRVIANAIADGNYSELTMRIPAEPDRDADIVVMRSALALADLEQQVAALTKERNDLERISSIQAANAFHLAAAQAREAKLREALELWKRARDNAEESELDEYACYCIPMPLFCDAEEAMDEALTAIKQWKEQT